MTTKQTNRQQYFYCISDNGKEKEQRKNGNFASGDIVNGSDIKKAIQFIYINYSKLFELYRNEKGNFIIKQVPFIDNLTELKVIKK